MRAKVIDKGIYKIGDDLLIWDEDCWIGLRYMGDIIYGEIVGLGKDNRVWATPFINPDSLFE